MKRSLRIYCRTRDGFCNSGRKRPPCRMTRWMDENELKDLRFCLIHLLPKKKFRFSYDRSLLTLSFCAKRSKVAVSTGEPSNCHSARSKAKSQNLIVILRIVKRSPRIYWRTDDGFCNSGRKRPPCRMTPWMADNELKDLRFSLIHLLPKKKFRFSYDRSLLTPSFCAKRSEVAESNCHSAHNKT